METHPIRMAPTRLGELAAHPAAFGAVAVFAVLWYVSEPESLDWHGAATLVTWMMTLVITRSAHRNTQAIHAKLDALLRVDGRARNELTSLDDEELGEVVEHREEARRHTRSDPA